MTLQHTVAAAFAVAGIACSAIGAISLVSSGLCPVARVAAEEARDGWAFGLGGLILLAAAFVVRLS